MNAETASESDSLLDYQQLRGQMKNGDILLFKGASAFSRLIRWACKTDYSHAGIVAWWGDRLMVLEATAPGVVVSPISKNLEHYPGGIDYFRLQESTELSAEKRQEMLYFALKQLGKKYATWRLFPFFFKLVTGTLKKRRGWQPHDIASSYFCSEYVSAIYNAGDLDLDILQPHHFTSPGSIAKSPLLERVGRLR
ncbi:YiiX/YebB-like N1pC/P60 family cysteine hydrolase [Aliiglaciecola sp. CAU 1673]|uniref:YiiX/YebB-like N1pC/P60 family cysteine hydrolase n=1 Tax=Aliiglaciecola sp. CAU 1673 TaxID=3032595 RepID=UPI0023DB0DA0|nr:YiiX/YebB-like N1pC/P60 family cysteine hydrolase [Aliiglaciecola sp. CAU 1673]MDF2180099.1 YiiX/YebB-like N1pC/P60 family cysteine hydrolase [Aliiglaciecola sp. CAU 1673]